MLRTWLKTQVKCSTLLIFPLLSGTTLLDFYDLKVKQI